MAPDVPRETPDGWLAEPIDRRPKHGPCDCNTDHDPVVHGASHRLADHTECWGWPPCGGCDSCLATQASYYASLRTAEPASWDVHSAAGVVLCWGWSPARWRTCCTCPPRAARTASWPRWCWPAGTCAYPPTSCAWCCGRSARPARGATWPGCRPSTPPPWNAPAPTPTASCATPAWAPATAPGTKVADRCA